MSDLAPRVLAGDVRATARLIRNIDDRIPGVRDELKALYPHTGNAYVVGITGAPGSGKSSLTDQLIEQFRRQDHKVGVLAVDPSSPFSKGAILGDRIRMQRHAEDPQVFIRSLATRGALGGLSRATRDATRVLDAFGCTRIIIETVGVGQDEVDIVRQADTTLVVTIPHAGDDIQAIKAGVLEIADIFIVNKADLKGFKRSVHNLQMMIDLRLTPKDAWKPPIVATIATQQEGLSELISAIERHREHRRTTYGHAQKQQRLQHEFLELVRHQVLDELERILLREGLLAQWTQPLLAQQQDPLLLAERFVQQHVTFSSPSSSDPKIP